MPSQESLSRLEVLRRLLSEGTLSTQDELREKLEKLDFTVTQSTISRDLRKLGAVRAVDPSGRTVYRQSEDAPTPLATRLGDLVLDIRTNGSLIVIHTSPGSASLVARHLDQRKPGNILGTLAGEDTIFVAPGSLRDIRTAIREIEQSFGGLG